jgi:hypothetical protein
MMRGSALYLSARANRAPGATRLTLDSITHSPKAPAPHSCGIGVIYWIAPRYHARVTEHYLAELIRNYEDVDESGFDDDLAVIRKYASIGREPVFLDRAELLTVIDRCENLEDFDRAIDDAIRNES